MRLHRVQASLSIRILAKTSKELGFILTLLRQLQWYRRLLRHKFYCFSSTLNSSEWFTLKGCPCHRLWRITAKFVIWQFESKQFAARTKEKILLKFALYSNMLNKNNQAHLKFITKKKIPSKIVRSVFFFRYVSK
jgi:hypothetical protein